MALPKENKTTTSGQLIDYELYKNQLLDLLPVAVYTCNAEGYIQTYNKAAVEFWGREPELNKDKWFIWKKLYKPDGTPIPPHESPVALTLQKGRTVEFEVLVEKHNGEKRNIVPNPRPIFDDKGKLIGVVNTLIDITEQVNSQKKIAETEMQSSLAIDAAELGTFDWNLQTQNFKSSAKLLSIFGISDSQTVSHQNLIDVFYLDDNQVCLKALADAQIKGTLQYEARVLWNDNSIHWIKVYGKIVFNEKHESIRMCGTVEDITEQKTLENKLRTTAERFELLADSMPQFVWTADDLGNIHYFNKAVYNYSGLNSQSILDLGWLSIVHPEDKEENINKWMHSITTGQDFYYEHRFRKHDGTYRWQLSRAVPEKDAEGKIVMWIGTSTDIHEYKNFASELEKTVKERTEDLIKQNQFAQTLIDSSVDSVMVIDINEVVVSLNKTANDLFAPYFPESIVGKTLEQIDSTTKSKPDWKYTSAALNGEYIYRKDKKSEKEDRYFDIYYIPLKQENKTYAIMLIIREVTEAVFAKLEIEKSNTALKQRNEFIEAIFDNSHEWIAVYDKELTLISINKASQEMLGIKKEDLIGKKLGEIFPHAIGSKSENDLLRSLNGEYIQNEVFNSGITDRYIKNYITPLKDANGNVYAALAIAHDMTEFKRAEEKIKNTITLLSEAQRLANIGSWDWNVLENEISWTDEMYRIFGVSKDTFKNNFENYINCIHESDRKLVSETIQQAMQTHKPYNFYHRIVHPDGTIKTIHGKGEVFINDNDEVVRLSGTAQDVTESIEMENKLKQSEMRHHLMTEQIDDYAIIFLNPQGNIEDWNKGAQKIKGYTEAEIIGLHFSVFYTKEDRANKIPEKILKEARENKKSINEGWRLRKDGTQFWANVVITALIGEDGNLISFSKLTRDLTEQKIAEEEINKYTQKVIQQNLLLEVINKDLANQKAFAELLIESSPLMILAYDKNMLITTWNKKSEEHNNLKKEDVLGKHIFEIFHDYNNENWINTMNDVLQFGKTLHYPKVKFKNQSGWGEIFVVPLRDTQNQIIGVLSITKEITELVKITSKLKMKNEELEKSNKELASFSYIASHDLQEPLRKISTFTSRLQEKYKDQLSKEAQLYVDKIESSSKRMTTLIQDLLNYSRLIDHEKIFEQVDLNLTLKNVINDFELLIEQKQATIKIAKLPVIDAMPLQMNQLFYNLISNALKFSKKDIAPIIKISVRKLLTKEIKNHPELITSKKTEGYYELIFKDNGIGFKQEYAEQIFIIFKRLHSQSEYTGTGIGLGLSKKIVENHNGEIFCESIENEGSTFHIILPIKHI